MCSPHNSSFDKLSKVVSSVDYGGISGPRLEVLEERLRDDVISELYEFGGRKVVFDKIYSRGSKFELTFVLDFSFTLKDPMVPSSLFGKMSNPTKS